MNAWAEARNAAQCVIAAEFRAARARGWWRRLRARREVRQARRRLIRAVVDAGVIVDPRAPLEERARLAMSVVRRYSKSV